MDRNSPSPTQVRGSNPAANYNHTGIEMRNQPTVRHHSTDICAELAPVACLFLAIGSTTTKNFGAAGHPGRTPQTPLCRKVDSHVKEHHF